MKELDYQNMKIVCLEISTKEVGKYLKISKKLKTLKL